MKLLLSLCTIMFLWLQAPAEAQVRVLNDAVEFNGKVNTTQRKSLILQNESDQSKEYILKFLRGNIASSQNVKICLGNTCYDPKKDLARVKVKRSEEHTSELQSRENLVCRLLLEKKKNKTKQSN